LISLQDGMNTNHRNMSFSTIHNLSSEQYIEDEIITTILASGQEYCGERR